MIVVILVDDDAMIRTSLHLSLTRRYGEQLSVYEAENGEEALGIIASVPTDLVISDIKMPICTGIQLLDKLKQLDYPGESIVISGFDEYDYVRQAMKLGAADYLLKPIVDEELFFTIDNCLVRVRNMRQTPRPSSTALNTSVYEQQYLLARLLKQEGEDLQIVLKEQGICAHSCYSILTDPFSSSPHLKQELKKFWFTRMEELFSTAMLSDMRLVQGEMNGIWTILLFGNMEAMPAFLSELLKQWSQDQMKASISEKMPSELCRDAFSQAFERLNDWFFDFPSAPAAFKEEAPYLLHTERILDALCRLDFPRCCQMLQDLFSLFNEKRTPAARIRNVLADICYSLMQKERLYIGIIGEYKLSEMDIFLTIQDAVSLQALYKGMVYILSVYVADAKERLAQKDEHYIRKAKEYIQKEYKKDISSAMVSEHLSLHPNYFSALFKKKSGMTYSEYLRKIRIEEALRLMNETNMKLYEIAEAVGYHDTIHFNRAFRKETGQSPSVYRRFGLPGYEKR